MNLADTLNARCLCQTLDRARLVQALEANACHPNWVKDLAQTHPHLFSQTAVYMSDATHRALQDGVAALERVMALPAYQQTVLAHAPEIAQHDTGPHGVFMGYDFHLSPQGPKLIEINTNAGGAFLNAALLQAHQLCCGMIPLPLGRSDQALSLATQWMEMFRQEWRSQPAGASAPALRTVLIVDDDPAGQYLAPEFDLACHLFHAMGCQAEVADARDCVWRDGQLFHPALGEGVPAQLVYNRLTDFALAEPSHQALREAYCAGAIVMTPNPRAHALYADKRNLVVLSDMVRLRALGVAEADLEVLAAVVPRTEVVTPENQLAFWQSRKAWFFKPFAGYGSKGTYRGDKLTKGVWANIAQGGTIAQALVPPGERMVDVDGQAKALKFDLRAYVYRGEVQLLAARAYSGQTTNFRTEGGGFSPVLRA